MTGLMIIAHAPLASALQKIAEHTFPDCSLRLQTLDVDPDMTPEQIEQDAERLLARVCASDVLVLTDVIGATPCNVAMRMASQCNGGGGVHVKVVSGVNVPMLWRALDHLGDPLELLVERAIEGACAGVKVLSGTKPQNQAQKTGLHDDQDAHQHQQ